LTLAGFGSEASDRSLDVRRPQAAVAVTSGPVSGAKGQSPPVEVVSELGHTLYLSAVSGRVGCLRQIVQDVEEFLRLTAKQPIGGQGLNGTHCSPICHAHFVFPNLFGEPQESSSVTDAQKVPGSRFSAPPWSQHMVGRVAPPNRAYRRCIAGGPSSRPVEHLVFAVRWNSGKETSRVRRVPRQVSIPMSVRSAFLCRLGHHRSLIGTLFLLDPLDRLIYNDPTTLARGRSCRTAPL
jgi:hypothetical protein